MFSTFKRRVVNALSNLGKRQREMNEEEAAQLRNEEMLRKPPRPSEEVALPTPKKETAPSTMTMSRGSPWDRGLRFADTSLRCSESRRSLNSTQEPGLSSIRRSFTNDRQTLQRESTLRLFDESDAALPSTKVDQLPPAAYEDLLKEVGPIYFPLLESTVKREIARVVETELHVLDRCWKDTLYSHIRSVALRLIPTPKGVLKAIRRQKAIAIPIEVDEEDVKRLTALRAAPDQMEVISDKRVSYFITAGNMKSCFGTTWLFDSVINYYCALIEHQFSATGIITLGSFLYTAVSKNQDASRWTNQRDIFSAKKVLMVINRESHWTLAVLNNDQCRLEYYDSMGGDGKVVLDLLGRFLDEEYERKTHALQERARGESYLSTLTNRQRKRLEDKTLTPWLPPELPSRLPRHTPQKRVPQQSNGYDCGVFTCQFCLYSALDLGFQRIGQSDMPFLRNLIALELLEGRLMPRI